MNLALQDAAELAEGLLAFYDRASQAASLYTAQPGCPRSWEAVEFSHWMLQLPLAGRPGTAQARFHEGLLEARLTRLMKAGPFARDFAVTYVGVDQ
jgi:p-hydroxybenzoate 3-monooxygenase